MDDRSRILIVDDERHNIKLLTEFLRLDYKIMAAKTGEQALKALESVTLPDLILLDIMMPGIDGYEVLSSLKSNELTKEIPVIFITALESTSDESKGFEMGAVDYIKKPFKPIIVKARVKTHIELKRKTLLLERMASIDGLTQISNRRSFDNNLEKEVRRASRTQSQLSMVMMDIDFFKGYNDHYGHAGGDDCLQRVAGAVSKIPKRAGDTVSRYGGEEFAVILPNTPYHGAIKVSENIRQAVEDLNLSHAGSNISEVVTMSLGVTTVTGGKGLKPLNLIKKADEALYMAKEQGRNRVCGLELSIQK
jgi:diguanylate cyclase (GGDEF)-like protein